MVEKGVVEERRRGQERELDAIRADIDLLSVGRTESIAFIAQVKIAYVILMSVFMMGFYYTHDHIKSAQNQYKVNETQRNETIRDIIVLQGKLLLVEDRYTRLIEDIARLSEKVSQLVQTIAIREPQKRWSSDKTHSGR